MHHIHHFLRILIRLRGLLGQQVLAVHTHGHTSGSQLIQQLAAVQRLPGGSAAFLSSRAMAGCAESLLHRALGAYQHKRVTAHIARNEHRLSHRAILLRHRRMTRRKGARCSLAMHTQPLYQPIYLVLLHLGDVVADIVDQRHLLGARLPPEHTCKGLPHTMHQQLPVRPGKVRTTRHRRKVGLPIIGLQGQTCQLPVHQVKSIVLLLVFGKPHVILSYLVSEPARATVNGYDDLTNLANT